MSKRKAMSGQTLADFKQTALDGKSYEFPSNKVVLVINTATM
jgi:hypothetical protein